MEFSLNNNTVAFSGLLNEESPIEMIQAQLEKALSQASNRTIFLDFSSVKRANSCGILAWYKMLESISGTFIYVNVPRWLVEQFNISDFLSEKTKVESIQASFYCPQNDTHETLLLYLGKEIPIQKDYDGFTLTLKNKEGLELEMDFEPSEYFYFISSNVEKLTGG